ncbi:MAG: SPASM domain-containing protein [Deltaproteobacteria bacterium]|nr:SPASM domain-containing protein [Deltaproteobacteria bacterium]
MKINKVQFSLGTHWKDLRYHFHRGRGHLLRYMWNRFKWFYFPRLHIVPRFPDHVDIELSSICDMKCPMCYTTTAHFKEQVPKKLMDMGLFKKIIDECASYGAYSIRLSLRGEPFLNRNIVEMCRYAKHKGIKEVSTLTNGLKLNPELFEQLMDAGLDWMTISFDGIGETYNRIRKPATFEGAVEKIRQYHEIKKRRGVKKPVVKIQSVWPAIADNPQAFYDLFNPIVDQVFSNPLVDYLKRDREIVYEESFTCPVLWQRLVIGSDGSVFLCINDEFGKQIIGNVREQSLHELWHGPKMQAARHIHLHKGGVKHIDICRDCHLPRKTEANYTQVGGRVIQVDNYANRVQVIGQ